MGKANEEHRRNAKTWNISGWDRCWGFFGQIPELEVAQKITTEKNHPATENRDWQKEERVFLEFSDRKCGEVIF